MIDAILKFNDWLDGYGWRGWIIYWTAQFVVTLALLVGSYLLFGGAVAGGE